MRSVFRWSVGVAVVLSAAAAAQPVTTEVVAVPEAVDTVRATATQDVKFKDDEYGRMTVSAQVAGRGPYRFLVDTGADRSSVSTVLAEELRLEPGQMATLHTVTGTTSVETASVQRVQLSTDRLLNFEAALLEDRHMGADGILGVDSLRSQRVTFDFKKRMISIVPSSKLVRRDQDEIVVRGQLRRGHLIITRARVERQPTVVVLDTGAELTIGNDALRQKLGLRRLLRDPLRVGILSVTGDKLVGDVYFLKEVEIGGMTMRQLGIFFADVKTFHTLGLEKEPAILLGMNAMRAFDKVSIDFANKKLRVLMPREGMLGAQSMTMRSGPLIRGLEGSGERW